jgi:hypothetical protein
MADVHRSFRLDPELYEAVERLAKARGQNFSAFVVSTLEAVVEGRSPSPAPDLDRLQIDLSRLADTIRAERLTHSELTESIIALARLTRELEQERQRMKLLADESTQGLQKAQGQLQEMVTLGGFASEKCREVVSGMQVSLARVEALAGKTVPKFEEGLRRVEESSASIAQAGKGQVAGFEKAAGQIVESFQCLKDEFQVEMKAQAHAFVLKTARRWQWITAAVAVCLLTGVGASFFWNHFSQKDKIQELTAARMQSDRDVYFFLREACNGRRVPVDKQKYCSAKLLETPLENPFK